MCKLGQYLQPLVFQIIFEQLFWSIHSLQKFIQVVLCYIMCDICCCHSDRTTLTSLGNVTADDAIVSSLVYVSLTSLKTYLTVLLELTSVGLPLCSVCRCASNVFHGIIE